MKLARVPWSEKAGGKCRGESVGCEKRASSKKKNTIAVVNSSIELEKKGEKFGKKKREIARKDERRRTEV